jgi:uncharacterized protein YrrD
MDELTFNFGAKVHCLDSSFGSLTKLVVEPENRRVVDLIAENGFFVKRARVIPLSKISSMDEDGIYLGLTSEEMLTLSEYRETTMERPADSNLSGAFVSADTMTTAPLVPMVQETIREGISPKMKVLSSHTAVENEGTTIGKIQAVQIGSADHQINSIVVRHGLVFTEVESIPVHEIEHFAEEVVALRSPYTVPPTFAQKH